MLEFKMAQIKSLVFGQNQRFKVNIKNKYDQSDVR